MYCNFHLKHKYLHALYFCVGMGFNDREIVALLGAHALGRCHTDRSGYWGPWTFAGEMFFVHTLSK